MSFLDEPAKLYLKPKSQADVLTKQLHELSEKWWKVYKWIVSKSNEAFQKNIHPADIDELVEKVDKFEREVEAPLINVMKELTEYMTRQQINEVFYGYR